MTLLWAILAIMAMAGAVLVLLPVLKYTPRKDVSSDIMNSMVYRDRLQELESDLQQGRVTQDEFTQLKSELELTLLEDVAVGQKHQGPHVLGSKRIVWPLLVLIPAIALGFYWKKGFSPAVQNWLESSEQMNFIVSAMQAGDYGTLQKQDIQLPDLARALQRHLQEQPEDDQSWYLLGVTYMQGRMPKQAELAFTRALSLDGNNIDYILGYAQAAAVMNNGELPPQIQRTLFALIDEQPDNPKPYMTLGMAAFQGGNFATAIDVWQRYVDRPNADPGASDLLKRSIAMAQRQSAAASAGAVATSSGDKPTVRVTVTVAEDVRKQLSPSDTLFIYAKAVQGPPMPLAVVRQPVGNWPVEVQLSDANSMTPMATLSKFSDVVVQARISATGNAIPQSGDWVGPSQVLKLHPGEQQAAVEINNRMP